MYLNDQLLDAVANSNLLSVKELLNSGANVNAHDGDFVTALQIAAARGDDEMVNLLINHGADVTKADQLGFSPFLRAIYGGHLKVIETLLLHYPSPEMATKETTYLGATPMTLACSGGHIKVVQLLHALGFSAKPASRFSWCPLPEMAAIFCKRGLKQLGEDVWIEEDESGLETRREDLLSYLLERENRPPGSSQHLAEVNRQHPKFFSLNVLSLSAICNKVKIYGWLIEKFGANENLCIDTNESIKELRRKYGQENLLLPPIQPSPLTRGKKRLSDENQNDLSYVTSNKCPRTNSSGGSYRVGISCAGTQLTSTPLAGKKLRDLIFTMPVEQQYPKQLKKCPKLFNRFF